MRDDAGNFPQREGRLRLEWFTCTRLLGNARLGADKPSGLSFTGVTGHPAGTRHFCSRDVDLTGTKALHNLAIVYEQLSRWELAQSTWEEILAESPGYFTARIGVLCRLRLDDLNGLDEEIAALRREPEGLLHSSRLQALTFERRGDRAAAVRHLRETPEAYADDLGILTELARMRYLGGELDEARLVLERLTAAYPDHVAGWNNLATVLCELGQREEAESAFRRTARLTSKGEWLC